MTTKVLEDGSSMESNAKAGSLAQTSPVNTPNIDEIVNGIYGYSPISKELAKKHIKQYIKASNLSLLKRIEEEVIGEDEELQIPNPGVDNFKAVERSVGRNQVRNEQRQSLKSIEESL